MPVLGRVLLGSGKDEGHGHGHAAPAPAIKKKKSVDSELSDLSKGSNEIEDVPSFHDMLIHPNFEQDQSIAQGKPKKKGA